VVEDLYSYGAGRRAVSPVLRLFSHSRHIGSDRRGSRESGRFLTMHFLRCLPPEPRVCAAPVSGADGLSATDAVLCPRSVPSDLEDQLFAFMVDIDRRREDSPTLPMFWFGDSQIWLLPTANQGELLPAMPFRSAAFGLAPCLAANRLPTYVLLALLAQFRDGSVCTPA
jgi:hypothetical protein